MLITGPFPDEGCRAREWRVDVVDVDDAHGPFRIDRVCVVRFSLIRDEHRLAVRRERDHVGQSADGHAAHLLKCRRVRHIGEVGTRGLCYGVRLDYIVRLASGEDGYGDAEGEQ